MTTTESMRQTGYNYGAEVLETFEQYIAASQQEMRDVVSPAHIRAFGGFALANSWLGDRIQRRFSDNPREVISTLTTITWKPWQDYKPGVGIQLDNMFAHPDLFADQIISEESTGTLQRIAMPDTSRVHSHRNLSRNGVDLLGQIKRADHELDDSDLHGYITQYDRVQTAHIAKSILSAHGIESLSSIEHQVESEDKIHFEQIEWEILPSFSGIRISELLDNDPQIKNIPSYLLDLERLKLFDTIIERYGHENVNLYRSRPSSIGNEPYYVAEVIVAGKNDISPSIMAVAESPVYGNATYLVDERVAAGNWQEVLELTKAEARSVGSKRISHPSSEKHEVGSHHYHQDRVMRWLRYGA